MNKKEILKRNPQKFLDDFKRVREVMICTKTTFYYFTVKKRDVLRLAEQEKIVYTINDKIFVSKRDVMVIE